ncbi:glycosyl transferase, group 1 family [Candidatus Pelagibacter sp. HTCC7211]|uniref:glycosyltransferase n=1 Tax=Pelagibacter sp. (strain HTCC7211) TaxID=439493 RepID=UPI000183B6F1|nr:glycosyltransferase [Candidatus Pelagibacter sp. HTCC7211]EDZ60154.1 glycosyl transferase, group 1 family [Candidatus Pelagibacter sp. HTCC7211]
MKICFLDNSPIPYTPNDLNSKDIRGGENVIIHLSKELAKLNNNVEVFNNNSESQTFDNVKWTNINNTNKENVFDYAFTNNDIRLFNKISAKNYIAFSHSIQSIEKFIRKGQLLSFLKYKPKVIILGKYHDDNRNFLLKLFGKINLQWAVDPLFLEAEIDDSNVENRAIFTSRRDRNLDILIDIWKKKIFPKNKSIKLFVTPSDLIENNFNIYSRNFDNKISLLKDMLKSKVLLVPGHKGELFCIAAEEARELCIPIITLGIGSLSERVEHGITGFIAKNSDEFADFTLNIFNNYNLWNEIRNNLLNLRGSKKWKTVASNLLKQL